MSIVFGLPDTISINLPTYTARGWEHGNKLTIEYEGHKGTYEIVGTDNDGEMVAISLCLVVDESTTRSGVHTRRFGFPSDQHNY